MAAPRGRPLLWFAAALLCSLTGAGASASRSSSTPSGRYSQDCARCWKPPPPSQANPIDITVIVSFNREGAILGQPRITYRDGEGQR